MLRARLRRLSEAVSMKTEVAVFAIDPGWMSTAMTDYLANSEQDLRPTAPARSLFSTPDHVPTSRAEDLDSPYFRYINDKVRLGEA
jgi:NAD(P)-dependent dehydrogenase (short-subunit alcohol dehydrogenase family)